MKKSYTDAALSILTALGGNKASGMCRCPAHDDGNPSLSVSERNGKVLFKCFAGCTQDAVLAALRQRGLWPLATARTTKSPKSKTEVAPDDKFDLGYRIARAATQADLKPEAYFRARGLKAAPPGAMLLPSTDTYRFLRKRYPAVVCCLTDRSGKLRGSQVTFLNKSGNGKLNTRTPRRRYGAGAGAFFHIGRASHSKPLIVGEGIESTASAAEIAGLPAIAVLSASNMKSIKPPPCKSVIICGDNDKAGKEAAAVLAERLVREGKPVSIALPPGDGEDWNDVLKRGEDLARYGELILHAEEFKFTGEEPTDSGLTLRAISEFDVKPLDWLWEPFIVSGAVNLVYGDGGLGKTSICLDLAARLTTGKPMPNCEDGEAVKGSVIVMSKEEDIGMLLRPRLEAAGADLAKVHAFGRPLYGDEFAVVDELATTTAELERQIRRIGDVKLVIIDPVASFAGNLDLNSNKGVRQLLDPLRELAGRCGLAVIAINHLSKATDSSIRHRSAGSVDLINTPRSALFVGADSSDPDRRLLIQVKTNLTREANQSIGFFFKTARSFASVVWESEMDVTDPDELTAKQRSTGKKAQSVELLKQWLSEGARPVAELKEFAKAEGISWRTIETAKSVVGVRADKRQEGWFWCLLS